MHLSRIGLLALVAGLVACAGAQSSPQDPSTPDHDAADALEDADAPRDGDLTDAPRSDTDLITDDLGHDAAADTPIDDERCTFSAECRADERCDPRRRQCVPRTCDADAQCGQARVCQDGGCLTTLRLVNWNIAGVGAPDTGQFASAVAILTRLAPDIVAIQEVQGVQDEANLSALADALEMEFTHLGAESRFGSLRNAVLSKLEPEAVRDLTSTTLSGDSQANDVTRPAIEFVVQPEDSRALRIFVHHAKSGGGNDNEFRQVVEAIRLGQATLGLRSDDDHYVVVGDFNEEITTGTRTPEVFRASPEGLPSSFALGADLDAAMAQAGLVNDPFHHLTLTPGPDTTALEAFGLDGSQATRPSTGRRIDYVLVSDAVQRLKPQIEIYQSDLDDDDIGLPKRGDALGPGTSAQASDHLPLLVDLYLD